MSSRLQNGTVNDTSYLYSPGFDSFFIFGSLVIALSFGLLASLSSAALLAVVFLNVWLFANPHIFATYTRIGSKTNDIKKHWFLIFLLPSIVLVGVTVLSLAYEIAGLFTLYLFAQTYHITRQSFGIARNYRRIDGKAHQTDRLSDGLIYIFPLWGLLNWCAQAPAVFLGYPINLPTISFLVVHVTGIIAVALGVWWLIKQYRNAVAGRLSKRQAWFVASHAGIFVLAYLWITDITLGWLIVNIWHNVQYLVFVWLKNLKRDAPMQGTVRLADSAASITTSIVLPWKNAARYFVVGLLAGAAVYMAVGWAGEQLLWLGLPTVLIAHFTINFHHYLVDGVIWKRPNRQHPHLELAVTPLENEFG